MPNRKLSDRLWLQIEVALDQDSGGSATMASQDERADRLGLTRAEIDAARDGRSFDIQTAAAIDFARAVVSHDQTRVFVAAVNAITAGISMEHLHEIATCSSLTLKQPLKQ